MGDEEEEVEEGEPKMDEDALDMPPEGMDDFGLETPDDDFH